MVAKLQRPGQVAAAPVAQAAGWGLPPAQPVVTQQPQHGAPNGGWLPPSGNTAPPPVAAGWGAPQAPDDQRQRMQTMLTGEDPHAGQPSPAQQAQAAFGGAVGDARAAVANTDYDAPAPTQAPSGWGAPAPVQHTQTTTDREQDAAAAQRQPGQPSPGKARRTKAEMEEDATWEARNAQPVQVDTAPLPSAAPAASWPASDVQDPVPAAGAGGKDLYLRLEQIRLKMDVLRLVFADPATDFDGGMDAAREMWTFISDV